MCFLHFKPCHQLFYRSMKAKTYVNPIFSSRWAQLPEPDHVSEDRVSRFYPGLVCRGGWQTGLTTDGRSGKVKRIRSNPAVAVAPCDMRGQALGPTVQATARILSQDEGAFADHALLRKYGWQMRLLKLSIKLQRQTDRRIFLEIAAAL